jgi:hypothetical protein
MGRPQWYERVARLPIARLSIPLNLGDIMFIIARRSGPASPNRGLA